VLQRLDALELDWGDQDRVKSGIAVCSNGFRVQVVTGSIPHISYKYNVADFSSIWVYDPRDELFFNGRYLSKRLETDFEDYDPESERYLRSWVQRQLTAAVEKTNRRRNESFNKFWG
jgi:hypothetical protein